MKRIKKSLGLQIFLGLSASSAVVALILFFVLQLMMPGILYAEISRDFYEGVDTLIKELELIDPENSRALLLEFSSSHNADVSLLTADGEEIYSVHGANDIEESDAFSFYSHYYGLALTSDYIYEVDNEEYIVIASVSLQSVSFLENIFMQVLPYTIIIIVVLSALVALLYSKRITKPIIALSKTSQQLAEMDLSWRSNVKRNDEIGLLATNLNLMAEHLDNAMHELMTANHKLEEDITRERAQEKQRSDFFAAVSHELKTPITVAKYDLEGMMNNIGRYKDRDKYLAHAYHVMDEMEQLVREIMVATRISSAEIMLQRKEFNMSALVEELYHSYEELALQKDISMQRTLSSNILLYADESYLRKAVSNLLANAINHSPAGSRVNVALLADRLMITNTGVSIPQEELENIFLPFYRLDKSRNRNTGGSGLGLYFVKTILDLHGFSISVETIEDNVCFCIFF